MSAELSLVSSRRTSSSGSSNNAGTQVFNEIPAGALNQINLDFTTTVSFLPGSVRVYYNGQRLTPVTDYTEIGNNTIRFTSPSWARLLVPPNVIMVDFIKPA